MSERHRYEIRDTAGNRLSHSLLPTRAELTCRGSSPVPYRQVPDTDSTHRLHLALNAIADKQLPLGGLPENVTLSERESPLPALCRAMKQAQQR